MCSDIAAVESILAKISWQLKDALTNLATAMGFNEKWKSIFSLNFISIFFMIIIIKKFILKSQSQLNLK